MKRSQTLSLVLLAGAGVAAYAVARHDPSQRGEDALIYRSEQECVEARLRSPADCHDGFEAAGAAHATSAPRYQALADCESHHGRGSCVGGAAATPQAAAHFVPVMAAYMIGRTAPQAMPPQPPYPHRDDQRDPAEGGRGGASGYCTGSGGYVRRASGGGVSRVASSTRTTVTTPRVVSRGGMGATGKAMAAHGGGGS